jgi:hypothetical protein
VGKENKATMTLQFTSGTNTAANASAYQVTGGEWTSGTIQWSNKPAANVLLQSNISHNNVTGYTINCLTAVRHWYTGDPTGQNENYGIMLRYYNESTDDYNAVYSADHTDESKRPKLTISYAPPVEIIPDGVYYIRASMGLYLGTSGGIAENSGVSLESQSTSGFTQICQLWKITYLGQNYYSIRPMHKLDMGMHVTSGNVDIVTIGTEDTLEDVGGANCWGIYLNEDGTCCLNYAGTSSIGLAYPNGAIYPGTNPTTGSNDGSGRFKWDLELVTGMFLHDSNSEPVDLPASIVTEVEMGGTYTQQQLGFTLTLSNLTVGWTTTKSGISVNPTGKLVADKRGIATITASATNGSTQYTFQMTVTSIETIYVKNYYDSTISSDAEKLAAIPEAVSFLNTVYKASFNLKFVMDGSPIPYTEAIDECSYGATNGCQAGNGSNCSEVVEDHHKNVIRIRNDLSPSQSNRIAVLWSNCLSWVYCIHYDDPENPGDYIHTQLDLGIMALVTNKSNETWEPAYVIQVLSIDAMPNVANAGYSDVEIMSINLAHEVAHTLGMLETYEYTYYQEAARHNYEVGSSKVNDIDCIMEKFSDLNAKSLYNNSIWGRTSAMCDDCISILHGTVAENVYEN